MYSLISRIFGIGAMCFLFMTYQQNKRKKLIMYKLFADVCWVGHYLCLGAYGGAIPNFVGIFREVVFVNREKKKWANNVIWPIVFIAANLTLGILKYKAPIDFLPICASSLVTISLWVRKPMLTKCLTVPVCTSFLIYDIYVGSYIGIINESFTIISIIISLIKSFKKEKTK